MNDREDDRWPTGEVMDGELVLGGVPGRMARMTIVEAFKAEGYPRRASWATGLYLYAWEETVWLFNAGGDRRGLRLAVWTVADDDVLADDWESIEEPWRADERRRT